MGEDQAEVSPGAELITRPFQGLGRLRSPGASTRSGRITRRLAAPRPHASAGPSRHRPQATVEDLYESLNEIVDTANVTADSIRSELRGTAQIWGQGIKQTQKDTRQTIAAVTLTAAQQQELDSTSIA